MSKISYKNPKTIRIAQIVLGAIAVILSITIFVEPRAGVTTLVFLLSITLLAVGFERIAAGILPFLKTSSRIGNIILGIIAVVLGFVVLAFPSYTALFLVTLLAFGLLVLGIARIIQGITNKIMSKWSRAFLIGVGVLSLIISFIVFAHPLSGVVLLVFLLAINLLIIGIESIIHGVSGGRNISTTSTSAAYGK